MTRRLRIEDRLRAHLSPAHLEIEDESHMHSVPAGAESHFKIIVVSPRFEGLPLIARQRLVNEALADELRGGLHALAMKTLTPAQWEAAGGRVEHPSPACRGGSKADAH